MDGVPGSSRKTISATASMAREENGGPPAVRNIRAHSHTAITAARAATEIKIHSGACLTSSHSAGSRKTAVMTRCMKLGALAFRGRVRDVFGDPTETAVSLAVGLDRLQNMSTTEIGPQGLSHPDLCVSDLPQ